MTAERALETAEGTCEGRADDALRIVRTAVRAGRAMTASGTVAGLWTPADRRVLGAAERVGAIGPSLGGLAARYERRASRFSRLRGRLLMPTCVLVLGVCIAPLPGFVSGDLGLLGYLRITLLPLGAFGFLAGMLAGAVRRWELATWPDLAARVVLVVPGLRTLVATRSQVVLLDTLSMLLAAGEPATDALSGAVQCVANPRLRAGYARAKGFLDAGKPVADALRDAGVLQDASGYPVVSAGEAAGRLADSIERHATAEDETLTQTYEFIFEWIPRFVYFVVLALLASSFFL